MATALGVSRRTLERTIAAGDFPGPDARLGRVGLWRPETVATWMNGGKDR